MNHTIKEIRDNAFSLADKIIKKQGSRLAGTQSSLDAAAMLKDEMSSFTDKVTLEEFFIYKGAFLGWIRILVTFYLIGVIALWLHLPIISVILIVISLLILVFQFFYYKPMIDKLYPKRKASNVVGSIEPTSDVKQQIIISGHHDSARIFNFLIHQPSLYNLRVTGGITLVVTLLLVSIVLLFPIPSILAFILKVLMSLGFLLTGQMWFFASKKGTPGAGDNLISSTMALEIGRYFSTHPLKNTRIVITSFDAEEEGLRGSRAFAKQHQEEFITTPTYLLNTDCLYFLEEMFFLTTDLNCSVDLDKDLAIELSEIAQAKHYPATYKEIAFLTGGTDAAELAKAGVKATTLIAMPWSNNARANVYHTPKDTLDSIEKEAVDAAIDIYITYIEKKDC